jgi:hypothetical protein
MGMRGINTFGNVAAVFAVAVALFLAGGSSAAAAERNKCGCYKDSRDVCFCDKKAKCGCPGECEPKGCEEAREKQMQKEIDAETRRAADADRRRGDNGGKVEKVEREETRPEPVKAASVKKLSSAQAKQLVKLLDLYFQEQPDARARNAEELRNDLSAR